LPREKGAILFYDLDEITAGCYGYLYTENQQSFLESLAEDVTNNMPAKPVDPSKLKILTKQEYLAIATRR